MQKETCGLTCQRHKWIASLCVENAQGAGKRYKSVFIFSLIIFLVLFRIQLNLNLVLIISQLNLQGNIKTDKNKCAAIRANRVELHHSV